jgi:hypothetical protein
MLVRIRLPRGRSLQRKDRKNRRLALALGALLIPAALMAYVLGFWRLASDMGLSGEFAIAGLFSHWQVWIAIGVVVQGAASVLNRYGRGSELNIRRTLIFKMFSARPPESVPERKVGTR